ncbi:DUF1294 domain-containing protein [Aurantimonas sp. C2-6-R+9]|uniref:DUF1294 domain-containing protein n=1 Tax=unclassified Aurantimonas TaxID=2638230 RepID=UPI002E17C398|nr:MULTISPECIES: DUF1294 domain-containing protein [unclassified Aurantimonas]MEC5290667.1 DUF1294 domain-containing protein [Aurantimonas sp. C2-3-R2]MEC5380619.1 DUF1294 domain-containing protein [Aurantimonas sp. C2-6-R+9]MEC5411665.1 DUF1294 domain-containing protein [Aurantimonas sp. C2-4-R8]
MALWIGLYFLAINIAAYFAFVFDKAKARAGARRIPEKSLLRLALLGGSIGAISAQRIIRHKTHKEPFRTWLNAIAFLHLVVITGLGVAVLLFGSDQIRLWMGQQLS